MNLTPKTHAISVEREVSYVFEFAPIPVTNLFDETWEVTEIRAKKSNSDDFWATRAYGWRTTKTGERYQSQEYISLVPNLTEDDRVAIYQWVITRLNA